LRPRAPMRRSWRCRRALRPQDRAHSAPQAERADRQAHESKLGCDSARRIGAQLPRARFPQGGERRIFHRQSLQADRHERSDCREHAAPDEDPLQPRRLLRVDEQQEQHAAHEHEHRAKMKRAVEHRRAAPRNPFRARELRGTLAHRHADRVDERARDRVRVGRYHPVGDEIGSAGLVRRHREPDPVALRARRAFAGHLAAAGVEDTDRHRPDRFVKMQGDFRRRCFHPLAVGRARFHQRRMGQREARYRERAEQQRREQPVHGVRTSASIAAREPALSTLRAFFPPPGFRSSA
jgi:hypothetical protein